MLTLDITMFLQRFTVEIREERPNRTVTKPESEPKRTEPNSIGVCLCVCFMKVPVAAQSSPVILLTLVLVLLIVTKEGSMILLIVTKDGSMILTSDVCVCVFVRVCLCVCVCTFFRCSGSNLNWNNQPNPNNSKAKPELNHHRFAQNTRTYQVLLPLGLKNGQHCLLKGATELGLETVDQRRVLESWGRAIPSVGGGRFFFFQVKTVTLLSIHQYYSSYINTGPPPKGNSVPLRNDNLRIDKLSPLLRYL